MPALDAAKSTARCRHRARGFDEFHHPLRWHEQFGELLAESRTDEISAAGVMANRIDRVQTSPYGTTAMLMDLLNKAVTVHAWFCGFEYASNGFGAYHPADH